jgi:hypothetical protein
MVCFFAMFTVSSCVADAAARLIAAGWAVKTFEKDATARHSVPSVRVTLFRLCCDLADPSTLTVSRCSFPKNAGLNLPALV